ncbi:hypothetical protein DFQ27_007897 [Actinomortierella ambigua]|uniref:Nucleotide exchange factor SIL1 n=1 Tax=Actinomortierella ambigua TaxID=1343610 RepID=A0A9P6PTZ3_9FUNG|nr:hypothetical protein DFQ27_007897 [Actinomortierella ambigua]
MVRLFKRAVVILGLCAAVAMANAPPSHKVQVKNEDTRSAPIDVVLDSESGDIICREGSCYPRAFVPTHEFKEILEGQQIPPGLHVQMDFATHKKYAKLMDPNEKVDPSDPRNAVLVVDTDQTGTQHHDLSDSTQATFDTNDQQQEAKQEPSGGATILNDLPEFHKPNPRLTLDDHAAFTEYLSVIESADSALTHVEMALEELGELVSEMDFGLRLAQGSGLRSVMELLVCHPDTAAQGLCDRERVLRSNAALVVGNAVQNHPAVQKAAIHLDLHRHLLTLMTAESDLMVARRLVTAFGNIVRGNQDILTNEDILNLATAFSNSTDPTFRRKCAVFMADFADPDMRKMAATAGGAGEGTNEQGPQDPISSQREQPSPVPSWIPPEEINEQEPAQPLIVDVGPWCEVLSESLFNSKDSSSSREAIADAVEMLAKTFPDSCSSPIRHTEL